MSVVELLQAQRGAPIGVSDISRLIGINKATTHTVLQTLASRGYAVQDPETRKFRRGPALLSLGASIRIGVDPLDVARVQLDELCKHTSGNAAVSRHVGGGNMHVLLHMGGAFGHQMYRRENVIPFPSGVATTHLAWQPATVVSEIYARWSARHRQPGPLASLAAYQKQLKAIRQAGFHTGLSETPFPDVRICFTEAPAFSEESQVVFVISVSTLTSTRNPVRRFYPDEVLRAAHAVTQAIGGRFPAAVSSTDTVGRPAAKRLHPASKGRTASSPAHQ